MTKSILSVRWSLPVAEAHRLMEERRVRHLPVVGDDGALVGILSDRDVKRAMDPKFATFAADAKVGDYMNWPVLTADRGSPLLEVVNLLIREKISCVVVTERKSMVGIVTTEDLLGVLRDLLAREAGSKLELGDIALSPVFQESVRELNALGV